MTTLMQDIRYALRQLRKTPGFAITVLLTLALGIGANAAIFTLVNSVLLRSLPVADPQALVMLGNRQECCVGSGAHDDGIYSFFSTDTYLQLKKQVPEFQELAAMQAGFSFRPVTVRRDGAQNLARSTMGEFVSGNYFRTFGLTPAAGRLFLDSDDAKGAPMTAVMSYETWQHQYAGDPQVVGSTFWVNTKAVTIVGVAPEGYYGDRMISTPPEYYLPIATMTELANVTYVDDPNTSWLYIVGRMKPGVTMGALQTKVDGVLRQTFASYSSFSSERDKAILPKIHTGLTPAGGGVRWMQYGYESSLHLLTWIAALVLLIACANIANLLLVRSMGRRAEMSVRTALGAQRGRIMRQLLTESLLLAGLGGALGLLVAYGGTRMLLALAFPGDAGVPIHASPSPAVIGFSLGLSLVTGVLFGVVPAWMSAQARPADALRSGTRTSTSGSSLLQRGLVVLQVALSLILLAGAGLFLKSLSKVEGLNMGLNPTNRYVVHFNPQAAGYSQTQLEVLYRTIEERFHTLPGVQHVGIASYTPMEDNNNGWGVQAQGKPETATSASRLHVSAEYFASVGTKVIAGRGIGIQDTPGSPAVTVVNESLVKKMFKPGENPIGRRIGSPGPESSGDWEIVGVVEDTSYQAAQWRDHRMFFIPIMQRQASDKGPIEQDESLYASGIVVETDHPVNDMEMLSRKTLAAINPNMTVVKFQKFSDQIADMFTGERMLSRLTVLFGGLALLLAVIGLYGVTAHSVVRRTPEIGIRMALGAERGRVIAMVLRGAALQTLLGLAIGIPIAIVSVRFVKSQLYEIQSADPVVMVAAVVVLAVAALAAGMIPARRAASIDPVKALRME
jgi:macrolide transport system ATP-binding/permease protein